MPTQANIIRNFTEFAGLDYRSNNIIREQRFARDVNNADVTPTGDLTLRPGTEVIAYPGFNQGPWSIFINGELEIVGVNEGGGHLNRLNEETLTITGGAGTSTTIVPVATAGVYSIHAILKDAGGATVLDEDLGRIQIAYYTLDDLIAAVTALGGGWSAVYSGGTESATIGAIGLPLGTYANGEAIPVKWSETIPGLGVFGPPLGGAGYGSSSWLHEHFANVLVIGSRLYCPSDYSYGLLKYDGGTTYLAGCPTPDAGTPYLAAAAVAGGSLGDGITDSDYYWSYTYEMEDFQGGIVEGNQSPDVTLSIGGAVNRQADITIPAITACNAKGNNGNFMVWRAYANNAGTEKDTTLHVDDGAGGDHSLQVGNRAFFRDNAGVLQSRLVTARTSTTIKISGDAVTIANNTFISAGLKINLYRNRAGGVKKYLVRTFAEAAIGITYRDTIADNALGFEYVPPFEDGGHGPPLGQNVDASVDYYGAPICGCLYKNLAIWLSENGKLQFSDPDGPEYFVEAGSSIDLKSKTAERFIGIGATGAAIFAFKQDEIFIIRGDLTTGKWSQDRIGGIGCDSHQTIAEVNGKIWFWSYKYGLNQIDDAGIITSISYRIDAEIQKSDIQKDVASILEENSSLYPNLARGFFAPQRQRYFLTIPGMTLQYWSGHHPNLIPGTSLLFVVDTSVSGVTESTDLSTTQSEVQIVKARIWRWGGLDIFGGGAEIGTDLYFSHFGLEYYDPPGPAIPYYRMLSALIKERGAKDPYCYVDLSYDPIEFEYEHGWIYLDNPSTIKTWVRSELYSFRSELPAPTAFTVTATLEIQYKDGVAWSTQDITFDYDESSSIDEIEHIFEFIPVVTKAIKIKLSGTYWGSAPVISGWTTEVEPTFNPHVGRDNG